MYSIILFVAPVRGSYVVVQSGAFRAALVAHAAIYYDGRFASPLCSGIGECCWRISQGGVLSMRLLAFLVAADSRGYVRENVLLLHVFF